MIKHINDKVCLSVSFSSQIIAEGVFFHWFILVLDIKAELTLSNNTLLIFPMLGFEEFKVI